MVAVEIGTAIYITSAETREADVASPTTRIYWFREMGGAAALEVAGVRKSR